MRLLPDFMRDDEAALALSKVMNKLIQPPGSRIPTIRTWDEIDNLNEPECDELAWELDIDWYDSTGMSLEEKRETIKLAQQIKRKRGTKWAVERLISAYFGEGYVMEWYEMYDSPYTFVALTTNTNTDAQNFEKFVEAVKAAKNARSHLAGVFYFWQQGPDPGIEYRLDTSLHRYNFVREAGTYPNTATLGRVLRQEIKVEQADEALAYALPTTTGQTCGTYPRPGTLGKVLQHTVGVNLAAAFSLYQLIKAGTQKCGTMPGGGVKGAAVTNKAATALQVSSVAYGFVKCGTRCCGE